MASQAMILAVRDVCAGYGTAPVLRNISFTQQHGEVLGIVGHNGMGKTTLLRTIVGLLQTASGAIEFDGEPIEDMPAYRRSSAGIGYVPQGNLGFPDLSVAENLELAQAMKAAAAT
jgi:ABC-type branched-subunit amino acid transport system ATPase component